jgi:HD-like signal output (HDOD) protein
VEIQELFEGDIEIPIPPEVYYDFLEQLNNLVLSTVVMDRFKSIPDSVINMESFWKHNIGFGLAARTIASLKKEVNTERFFVAGILHDLVVPEKPYFQRKMVKKVRVFIQQSVENGF